MTETFDIIRTKRAVREFTDQAISDDVVANILTAGRLSGSAKNMQPWHFVAVQDRETLITLSQCGAFAGHLAGAALGIVLATPDPFFRLTVPFDLGRAAQNMMLTAWAEGIGSEMATIYNSDQARDVLGIPPDFVVVWCISFGYPAETAPRQPRKDGRRKPGEVIHFEKW